MLAVNLTADAVKAVSLTAMEALREGAAFIGIVGEQDDHRSIPSP